MRVIENARAKSAVLVLALSLLFAGDAWRYTAGWWVFGVLAVGMGVASTWLLIVQRRRLLRGGLPYPLIAFLALAVLSLAWSYYRGATLIGLGTTAIIVTSALAVAINYGWGEILRALSFTLRLIIGLSLAFELFVSLVLQRPILPFHTQPGVDYSDYEKIPKMLYWSRNELFEVFDEGRIQGIVGNANHLGLIALFAAIAVCIELADRKISRARGIAWLVVIAATLVFTRSATVTVALIGVALVAVAVLIVRRASTPRARAIVYASILGAVVAGIAIVIAFGSTLLELLGKSPDLTGRLGIWEKVVVLGQERPWFGWGWVSFWNPSVAPFDNLAFRNGVRQLQAHNVWIDVWFQLGIIGVILFAALVLSTAARSWSLAVDLPQVSPSGPSKPTALALLPLLLLTALLVQSVAESRLIVEFGFFFLVVIAVKTKKPASEVVD
jgi:exopolysaccharide production protein ExoQ